MWMILRGASPMRAAIAQAEHKGNPRGRSQATAWRVNLRSARARAVSVWLAILLSALAMSAIVGGRYLAHLRRVRAVDARAASGVVRRARRADAARDRRGACWSALVYGVPAGVVAWGWRTRGWTRSLRARPMRGSALVAAGVGARLPRAPRHLVLLDPPLDASAAPVQAGARAPPCQPTADRLGGDGVSSAGGADRRGGDPGAGAAGADSGRGARRRAAGDDGAGRHQSPGVGDVAARDVARDAWATG